LLAICTGLQSVWVWAIICMGYILYCLQCVSGYILYWVTIWMQQHFVFGYDLYCLQFALVWAIICVGYILYGVIICVKRHFVLSYNLYGAGCGL